MMAKSLLHGQTLLNEINLLTGESAEGRRFLLHFVSHGNKTCIGFKHTSEPVYWTELEEPLKGLNSAADHTTVLNMTTCKGLNAIQIASQCVDIQPFFGIIGYAGDLPPQTAIKINYLFYSYMAEGLQIQEAIEKVKKDTGDEKFHCITAQGYQTIKKN